MERMSAEPNVPDLLRIGSVPYLNARPLVEGLAERPDVSYVEEVPAQLATRLRRGELDAALVSSVEALRPGSGSFVPDLCIGTEGAVESVLLLGRDDPRRARRVALDGASLTAATLTRIVFRDFLGRDDVEFVRTDVAPDPSATGAGATLLIGDAALRVDPTACRRLDLGTAWTEATGLPFVWAAWLCPPGADTDRAGAVLNAAYRAGRNRTRQYAAEAPQRFGIDAAVAERYLGTIMRYPMGPRERRGLELFLELARTVTPPLTD